MIARTPVGAVGEEELQPQLEQAARRRHGARPSCGRGEVGGVERDDQAADGTRARHLGGGRLRVRQRRAGADALQFAQLGLERPRRPLGTPRPGALAQFAEPHHQPPSRKAIAMAISTTSESGN